MKKSHAIAIFTLLVAFLVLSGCGRKADTTTTTQDTTVSDSTATTSDTTTADTEINQEVDSLVLTEDSQNLELGELI